MAFAITGGGRGRSNGRLRLPSGARPALLSVLLALGLGTSLCAAQSAPGPADAPPPAAPASSRWPLVIDSGGDEVVMYQPQLETFQDDVITARAAVSVRKPGQQDPTFGVVWLQSRVATDRVARTVTILEQNITRAHFPDAQPADQQALADALRQRLAEHPTVLSLDQLLSMLEVVQKEQAADASLVNTVPKILFVDHPAVKVQYDGTPRLTRVDNSPLLRAVNTPFFVVLDPGSRTYFLKGAGQWYAAPDPLGPFRLTSGVPAAVAQLADQGGYQDPAAAQAPGGQAPAAAPGAPAGPSGPVAQAAAARGAQVEIITATEPTELIWTDGPEQMGTIPGTDLLFVTNTDSDVFLDINSQNLFVLLSGRWFASRDRSGPWAYVPPDKLPAGFSRIPPGSVKGEVLASVPGTSAARDAVEDTYIPQTATIDRARIDRPDVVYDGAPQFAPVEGTQCTYATNTSFAVLGYGNRYYCCQNAVWYNGGSPVGPWDVCVSVPAPIYALPPSCPIYAVRYCHVYGYTPDVVYVGYTPGYVGCYAYGGCVVYGTGYYYRPWLSERYYFPRPFTFGFGARYEVYTSHWGFTVGSAWGDVAFVSFLGGRDRVAPGGRWFGYGGYRPVFVRDSVNIHNTVNIRNVEVNRVRYEESRNLYARRVDVRHETAVRPGGPRGAEVHGGAIRQGEARQGEARQGGARPGEVRQGEARPGEVRQGEARRDDVYADPQGNVHRKTASGWETRQGNRWVPQGGAETPREAPRQSPGEAPRETPRETPREAPRQSPGEAPRGSARETPREAPRQAPRPAESSLDRDYRAREAGQDRYQNSPKPSSGARGSGGDPSRSSGGRSGDDSKSSGNRNRDGQNH